MNVFSRLKLKNLQQKVNRLHHAYGQRNSDSNLKGLVNAHLRLAQFYARHRFDRDLAWAAVYELECYRAIACLGEIKGHYICGKHLLERAKFWDNWAAHPIYGAAIHRKYAKALYEEAFAYLQVANQQDHVLARRLLGLVYLNGWGMPRDLQHGYTLVLESIDLENAWGRATRIFEELKLNSPEFFAALRSYQGKQPLD